MANISIYTDQGTVVLPVIPVPPLNTWRHVAVIAKSAHGKYMTAQPDGSIACDRTWLRGWELFTKESA